MDRLELQVLTVTGAQVCRTGRGPLFVEGETVQTADGLKFVAGLTIETELGPQLVSTGPCCTTLLHGLCQGVRGPGGQG